MQSNQIWPKQKAGGADSTRGARCIMNSSHYKSIKLPFSLHFCLSLSLSLSLSISLSISLSHYKSIKLYLSLHFCLLQYELGSNYDFQHFFSMIIIIKSKFLHCAPQRPCLKQNNLGSWTQSIIRYSTQQ